MSSGEEAGTKQLSELEQELIEKRRRLQLLDEQIQDEVGSSGTDSSPPSRHSGTSMCREILCVSQATVSL